MSYICQERLNQDALFLDTETTGFDETKAGIKKNIFSRRLRHFLLTWLKSGRTVQFMEKTRWCKKKEYWRAIEVCKHRAFKLNIKACQKCLQKYMQLQLPFKKATNLSRDIFKHVGYMKIPQSNKS